MLPELNTFPEIPNLHKAHQPRCPPMVPMEVLGEEVEAVEQPWRNVIQ